MGNKMRTDVVQLSVPSFEDSDLNSIHDYLSSFSNLNSAHEISKFENKIAELHDKKHVVALSSATSAIHLGLIALGITQGDKVIVPSVTFAATAFPIKYIGAKPIFIDVDENSMTLSLDLLEEYLSKCKKSDLPKAVVPVDLFGKTCDYDSLFNILEKYGVLTLLDSAESLGSKYKSNYSASLGDASVISFNMNKIITTTGGGVFITDSESMADNVRKMANQGREDFHWYEHSGLGFNYRLSPILAALGSSQLERLPLVVKARQQINFIYQNVLNNFKGIRVNQDSHWEQSNCWLTTVRFDSLVYPNARDRVRNALLENNIESRYIWKPLHTQPVFSGHEQILNGKSEKVYAESLCLPSSHFLTDLDIKRVCDIVLNTLK